MGVFVLHEGQPELASFLSLLRVPSGTALPIAESGKSRWTVLSWREPEDGRSRSTNVDMQTADAVRRASDAQLRASDLRRHGLHAVKPTDRLEGSLFRRYIIPVFRLEPLGVFAAGGALGPIGRLPSNQITPIAAGSEETSRPTAMKRAERAAVRAIYALGLDYGVVTVRSVEEGMPAIEEVNALPSAAAGPFAGLFAAAVNHMQDEADSGAAQGESGGERTLLLGMDPEFVLRRPGSGGKIVLASRFLERRGRVGCDSVRIGDKLVYPLAELRPSPAAEPEELFRNLYAAMRLAASRINDASLEWLAGGMPAKGLPLGGHIHVSGVPLNADLLRAMDNYMALPLVLLEDSTTKRRRPRYGALGDFRRQFHGGFEYRTLPSWIVSPAVAMGVLALAKVVCEHYRELKGRPLARPEVQRHYYAGNKEEIQPHVQALWTDLERTSSYSRYAKALTRLKRSMDRMEQWNEQQDVRKLWKIPPYRM
jgi:hypothetical protein